MARKTFSNGMEHSLFLDKYCKKCVNRRPDPASMGCHIESLILGGGAEENGFIQIKSGIASCLMFLAKQN